MGFWSSLGNIGSILGGAAQGGAQGQLSAGQLALGQGQLDVNRFNAENQARLAAAKQEQENVKQWARQAMLAELMANPKGGPAMQATPRANLVTFGGFGPADFGESVRAAGGNLGSLAGTGLSNYAAQGGGIGTYTPSVLPAAPQMPKESFWQKLGGVAGPALQMLPEIAKLFGKGNGTGAAGAGGPSGTGGFGDDYGISWPDYSFGSGEKKGLTPGVTTDWTWQDPTDVDPYLPPPRNPQWPGIFG